MMNGMDTAEYLKMGVGEELAHAVAYTIEQQPSNPVEFLALYLLQQLQIREVVNRRRQSDKDQLEKEKLKETQRRERSATVIQGEVRRYLTRKRQLQEEEERARRELEEELEEQRRRLEEEEIEVDEEGKEEDVIKAEKGLKKQELRFKTARGWLMKLDESKLEEMKRSRKPTDAVVKVLRATLLILDVKYTELTQWSQLRSHMKSASKLLEQILAYDPTNVQKVRKFKRVNRILKKLDQDTVKQSSLSAYLLFEWLLSAVDLRTQSVTERRAKKMDLEGVEEDIDDEETLSDKEDAEGDDAFGGSSQIAEDDEKEEDEDDDE